MRLTFSRGFAFGLGIATVLASTAAAHQTERFLGTGRACYGALTIAPRTMSWMTPFSRCETVRFRIIDRSRGRTTFRMVEISSECRYQVISLTHRNPDDPDKGWNVTGYHDETSYRADKAAGFTTTQPRTLSCYLIRDPDPTGPLDW